MLIPTLLFLPMDDLACLCPLPGYKMESVGCEEGRKLEDWMKATMDLL